MSIQLTPPDTADDALLLKAPEEPEIVGEDTAAAMIPVAPERQAEINTQAKAFIAEVAALNPASPEYTSKIDGINRLAGQQLVASANTSNRLLERSSSSVAGAKKTGNSAQIYVATTLGELRTTVEELTPNRADLGLGRKILGVLPGGNKLVKYFQKYESSQQQINNITKALLAGQDELRKDNASLAQEKARLWETMQSLSEYAVFAKALDDATAAKLETMRNNGQIEDAAKLDSDVLFPIRQRHQDILTQLAVSVQGYLAIDMIRKNNTELIKGVERARTTTLSALRTAVIVAQALANQKLVLDQIDALNTTTNNMILKTSEMLKEQTSRIHQQAASSGVSVETLQRAFDNVFQTIDAIDTFRSEANKSMEGTVRALESGIERAKPYLERVRQQEGN
jgi:uncharacterized protein YaaN involved in tellurite resistance